MNRRRRRDNDDDDGGRQQQQQRKCQNFGNNRQRQRVICRQLSATARRPVETLPKNSLNPSHHNFQLLLFLVCVAIDCTVQCTTHRQNSERAFVLMGSFSQQPPLPPPPSHNFHWEEEKGMDEWMGDGRQWFSFWCLCHSSTAENVLFCVCGDCTYVSSNDRWMSSEQENSSEIGHWKSDDDGWWHKVKHKMGRRSSTGKKRAGVMREEQLMLMRLARLHKMTKTTTTTTKEAMAINNKWKFNSSLWSQKQKNPQRKTYFKE